MNDQELDDVLNTWSVPGVPASLRKNVRAGFAVRFERRRRSRTLLRTGILGAVALLAFLAVAMQAFSRMRTLVFLPVRVPYTVDCEYIRYAEDGSFAIDMYSTSFNHNLRELMLSSSVPGHPLETATRQMLDEVGLVTLEVTTPFRAAAENAERIRTISSIRNGCISGPVVANETILGYATVAIQHRLDHSERVTSWMAPQLGCFVLRLTIEERRPDGSFRPVLRKQALSVHLVP